MATFAPVADLLHSSGKKKKKSFTAAGSLGSMTLAGALVNRRKSRKKNPMSPSQPTTMYDPELGE